MTNRKKNSSNIKTFIKGSRKKIKNIRSEIVKSKEKKG
jgi:hypothetical protein